MGDPRRERPSAMYGHIVNVPTHFNVKLPAISGHLPNAYSHLLEVSTCRERTVQPNVASDITLRATLILVSITVAYIIMITHDLAFSMDIDGSDAYVVVQGALCLARPAIPLMNGHLSRTDTLPAHRRYYCIFFVFSDEKMTTISLLPRRRPPGTKYGKWTEEDMNNAIADVNDGIGINRSSRDNGVPKATLLRHLYYKNVHANASKKHFGRCTDLPEAVEMQLAKHVIKLGEQNCGMTTKSLRHLAYEIAEAHHLKHRFNKDTEMAGKAWERRFRRSHPELSLRTPQPTSVTRLTAFTTNAVKQFFQLLKEALKQNDLCQSRIFNVDETGINIVHRLSKVFAKRGSKQVRGVTSAERGKNVTCVCCVSASGAYVPPMIIFPRKRIPELLKLGAIYRAGVRCHLVVQYSKPLPYTITIP